jgi:hypothetical protein
MYDAIFLAQVKSSELRGTVGKHAYQPLKVAKL